MVWSEPFCLLNLHYKERPNLVQISEPHRKPIDRVLILDKTLKAPLSHLLVCSAHC